MLYLKVKISEGQFCDLTPNRHMNMSVTVEKIENRKRRRGPMQKRILHYSYKVPSRTTKCLCLFPRITHLKAHIMNRRNSSSKGDKCG